jgi:glycosyltransferase involved in cell wall biosynthesis
MDNSFLPIFSKFSKAFPDFQLIIFGVGGMVDKKVVAEISEKLGMANKLIFKTNISDEELICLYRQAKLFVRYLRDEGFGLPVAEAMACECPVLVSDRGSLPEVVGDPGLAIPLENSDQWLDMMKKIISDQDFRASIIKKGEKKARSFDWNQSADKVIDLYRETFWWLMASPDMLR